MKKLLRLVFIFTLVSAMATMPLTLAEAKKITKKTSYKVSKSVSKKTTTHKTTKTKEAKQTTQKQQSKILEITLPSQKQINYTTKSEQKKTPRRCPNVRCRYNGVTPCPRHGKDYPEHWK